MVTISNLLIPTTFLFLKYKYLLGDEIEIGFINEGEDVECLILQPV